MSINACTIASSSVDTFCGVRRAIVIGGLINQLRPPQPNTTHGGHGGWRKDRPPSIFQGIHRPRWDQDEVPAYKPTELDHVTVAVEFLHLKGSETQKIEQRLDLVTVTDVNINPTTVGVNIENLQVHPNAKPLDQ